jgi:hypothetical protein
VEWKINSSFPRNIVAVHQRDWANYKYKTVKITYDGKSADFVVADYCADKDCTPKGCCTKNAAKFGKPKPFLLDMEARAVTKTWGTKDPENNFFFPVTYAFGPQEPDVKNAWKKLGAKWVGG